MCQKSLNRCVNLNYDSKNNIMYVHTSTYNDSVSQQREFHRLLTKLGKILFDP